MENQIDDSLYESFFTGKREKASDFFNQANAFAYKLNLCLSIDKANSQTVTLLRMLLKSR